MANVRVPASYWARVTDTRGDGFTVALTINVSGAAVYEAWTRREVLTRWLARHAVVQPRAGGPLTVGWDRADSIRTYACYVEVQPARLVIEWPNPPQPPTRVEVMLADRGRFTRLEVRHVGFVSRGESYDEFQKLWCAALGNLKFLLEARARGEDPVLLDLHGTELSG